jgi:hypothetical protein
VALVPGHLRPPSHRGHHLTGNLATDELVIVIPEHPTQQRQTVTRAASLLRFSGHPVRVATEVGLTPPPWGHAAHTELGM